MCVPVCLLVRVSDWQLICISSEAILRRVTGGEIKIASLVRASQSPSLLFKCWFAHQNQNGVCVSVCVFECISDSLSSNALVCMRACLKLWGYLARLSANNTFLKSDSFRSLT